MRIILEADANMSASDYIDATHTHCFYAKKNTTPDMRRDCRKSRWLCNSRNILQVLKVPSENTTVVLYLAIPNKPTSMKLQESQSVKSSIHFMFYFFEN